MIGKTLNRYKIVDRLGKGGMGEVWVAEDTRLGRRVALKMLPPEFAEDRERLARFEQEARTVAALSHPNIVTLHDIEEAEGQVFLVMELMSGSSLAELIPPKGLPEGRLFHLAIPLASAVAAAHERGVVHRDLKPSNAMVTEEGVLKVLDFGLAKQRAVAEDGAPTALETVSSPGAVLGTVPYMSPEQAQGKPVDHRSDIFSLGVILYEMATGSRPFKGESAAEVVSAILRDAPPALIELRPALPPRLARIINRCLEKDPRGRFQSALDLKNELEDLRQESSASGTSPISAAATPAPRARLRWLLAAGAVAVLAAVTVGILLQRSPEEPAPHPAAAAEPEQQMIVVFPFENLGAPEDDYFAAGITDEITSRLGAVGSLGVISRTSAVQYDRTGKTMAQIGEDLGVSYVLEGTVRWARSPQSSSRVRVTPQLVEVSRDVQVWSTSYDEQLDEIFTVQSDIAERVVQALDLTLGDSEREALRARPTRNLEAYQIYLRGIDNTSRAYYSEENRRRTVKLFERAVELDPEFALAWAWLSAEHSYIYHLRFDATEKRRDAARRAVDRALELQPDLPDAHLALGLYHYRCFRDYDSALAELSIAGEDLPSDYRVLQTIGAIQRRQGHWEDALITANRSLRLNPRDATGFWDTGITYMYLRRHEEANQYFDRAIAIAPDEGEAYGFKALNQMFMGDLERGRATLEAAPDVGNPLLESIGFLLDTFAGEYEAALLRARSFRVEFYEGPDALIPRTYLEAMAYELLGDTEAARERWEASRRTLEEEIRKRPDDARAHSALGVALAGLGLEDEAIRAGRRGVELYPVSVDAFHGPRHLADLAEIYTRVGEHDAALDLIEQLLAMTGGLHPKMLELEPRWAPLREHPRYRKLLESGS